MILCRREQSLRALCAHFIRARGLPVDDPCLLDILDGVRFHDEQSSNHSAFAADHPECMPETASLDAQMQAIHRCFEFGARRCANVLFERLADMFRAINGTPVWPEYIDAVPCIQDAVGYRRTEMLRDFCGWFKPRLDLRMLQMLCDMPLGEQMLYIISPRFPADSDLDLRLDARQPLDLALKHGHQRMARGILALADRFSYSASDVRYILHADTETLDALLRAGLRHDSWLMSQLIRQKREGDVLLCRAYGAPWPPDAVVAALRRDCFAVAEAAVAFGMPIQPLNRLLDRPDCLRWALAHGARWDPHLTRAAARNGQIGVLMVANEFGLPWSTRTALYADPAILGQVEALAPTGWAFKLGVALNKIL